ncbi:Ig-like domain-containing protein [Streptomyces sp. NPDC007083]|uniref:beta strand repeat-containing protein n=1 Tax=Streptomyces sp. NPDC007083 TaxID=3156913 RepID=UPI0033CC1244
MANTTTTLTSSPNPSVCGELVTFTITVAPVPPDTGTPTGTVSVIISDDGPTLIGTLDASGQAQVSINNLSVTTHQVIAVYNGDANFNPSASGLLDQVVSAAPTTTVVAVSPDPSVCGESVELCATVTIDPPGSGTPSGTVTFTGPGGLNETTALDASGEACVTTTVLATGTVTATYNGDGCAAASSDSTDVTVDEASTTTVVTVSPDPSVCGESVTVCATVTTNAPGSGTPTGTVTFTGPGGLNQTVALDATGKACLITTSLATGTVTATYNGEGPCFAGSTDSTTVTVNSADTTTAVTASPDPSVCGESVTVCATVSTNAPGSGTPTGTVTFTGPGGLNQTVALDATGKACLASASLASGTITAHYNGASCFNPSTGTATVTVNPAATTTAVTASPNPSVCGESVTVCATVTTNAPGSGTPTGTVTFTGPGGVNVTVALDATGKACFSSTSLTSGTITAHYNGEGPCFAPSTGTIALFVTPNATTTTVTATPSPSVCGQSVTVCATVTADPPGSGTPTGTVTFTGPGGLNQTVPLDATGKACFTTTSLSTGTITAVYNGSACNLPSADTTAVTVNAADTTTAVTASPDPSVCGESVTVCATVSTDAPGSGTPTGTVTFTGPGGLNQTVALDATGKACLASASLASGTITAHYNGASCFNPSTGTTTVTVNPAATTTAVTASPNPSVCGQSVTVCATVSTNAPGSGTPTGTVTFTGPGGLNQTVALDATGKACLASASLASGTITAHYNGASCFNPSTGTTTVTVNPAATTTAVTASPNPSVCGQSVTVCATVTTNAPGSGTPTGTVTFTGPGGVNVTVALDATGKACFSSTSLTSGTITAHYNGAACFTASTGTVAITSTTVATTMTAAPAQIRVRLNGTLVIQTMSATLKNSSTNAGIPGMTVTFRANSVVGPIVLGTAVTDANGVATLAPPTRTVPATAITASTYTASFVGSGCYASSSATAALTFVPIPPVP